MSIYHDGSNSHIEDGGTGALRITSNQLEVLGTSETLAKFIDDGAVELYHNDSKKIETTSAGVDVTGTVQGDTFTLDNSSNDWVFSVSSNKLVISYAGTAKMELDTSGNLKVTGDVTAFGSI